MNWLNLSTKFLFIFIVIFLVGCSQSNIAKVDGGEVLTDGPAVVPPVPAADLPNNVELGGVNEIKVVANNFAFSPSTLRVRQGDTIRLVVSSVEGEHGLAIREFNVDVQVNEGETKSAEFVADKKGSFMLYCSVYCGAGHKEMKGVFIVE